jgi:hypothetical protein
MSIFRGCMGLQQLNYMPFGGLAAQYDKKVAHTTIKK